MEKLFSEYTVQKWVNCCEHVKEIEKKYIERDGIMDECVDQLIIRLGEIDSEDSSGDTDTDDSDTEMKKKKLNVFR
ncbi:hypothetical protein C0J52_26988 [Blattella germanica]|nr:hypothetical protein C0J52_26988 [Blattella germanica]